MQLLSLMVLQMVLYLSPDCCGLTVEFYSSGGPGVKKFPIFFTAKLLLSDNDARGHTYRFVAEDPNNAGHLFDSQFTDKLMVSWNTTYPDIANTSMSLIVYQRSMIFDKVIASNQTFFNITDSFAVNAIPNQGSCHAMSDDKYVSTNCSTNLVAEFKDPNNFIQNNSMVNYFWVVNDLLTYGPFFEPNVTINTSIEGIYNVGLVFNAYFMNNYEVLSGYKSLPLYAKNPISFVNISGNMWLQHGDLLDLTVDCKGTSPWRYCWKVILGPYNKTGNEVCDYPTVTTDCHFYISRYLRNISLYSVLIILNNDVDHKVVVVTVNVYDVDRKPQLSTVIIPVTCSIIAVIFIVFGIGYFIQTRDRLAIEVADFDFNQQDTEPQTFCQRLNFEFGEFWKDLLKKLQRNPQAYNPVQ